jgi:hypothetical protein
VSTSRLTSVIGSRFVRARSCFNVDHLPHRLANIFAREGVELSRATLCDWVADVASALTPIGEQLRREIVAASYLQTDDTPSRLSLSETPSHREESPVGWYQGRHRATSRTRSAGTPSLWTTDALCGCTTVEERVSAAPSGGARQSGGATFVMAMETPSIRGVVHRREVRPLAQVSILFRSR